MQNEQIVKKWLAFLADTLSEHFEIDSRLYDSCSNLTPYGVKVRYPEQVEVDEAMTQKALGDAKRIVSWVKRKCAEALL